MSSFINKIEVLDRIKAYYNLKTSSELASFLGVAPTTISSWYSRKTFDLDILYSKCVGISFDWLLSGRNFNEEKVCSVKETSLENGQVNSQVNSQVDNEAEAETAILPSFLNQLLLRIDEKDKKLEEKEALIAEQARNIGALQKEVEMLQKGFGATGMGFTALDDAKVVERANAQR